MYACRNIILPMFICLLLVASAKAQFSGFPDEIQTRIDSGEYAVSDWGTLGLGTNFSPWVGSYFFYLDLTQTPAESRVIIRYNIGGSSVYSQTYANNPPEELPITGVAHLDGRYEYQATGFNFKLYLEDLDQAGELFSGLFPHQTIRLSYQNSNTLLSGEGSYRCLVDEPFCDPFDLESPDQPQICLACSCEVGATLWMSRIEYIQNGADSYQIAIDPVAAGQTDFPPIYQQHQGFPGFDGTYNGDPKEQWLVQRFELSEVLLADVNRDGTVNLLDVAPFVDLLSSDEYRFEADINMDSDVNLADVFLFVLLLTP